MRLMVTTAWLDPSYNLDTLCRLTALISHNRVWQSKSTMPNIGGIREDWKPDSNTKATTKYLKGCMKGEVSLICWLETTMHSLKKI